jgi:DNA-binding LytR/AlgR family response regulator
MILGNGIARVCYGIAISKIVHCSHFGKSPARRIAKQTSWQADSIFLLIAMHEDRDIRDLRHQSRF